MADRHDSAERHDRPADIEKFGKLIGKVEIAMMTTIDGKGALRSRPMMTQQVRFDGDLWFFSGMDSGKIGELEADPRVNLSFSDVKSQTYLSASGRAEIVRDRAKAEELWSPALKAWFPRGLDDPNLVLLRVRVHQGEYWDTSSARMVQLAGMLKAMVTGERAKPGEHGHLDVNRPAPDNPV